MQTNHTLIKPQHRQETQYHQINPSTHTTQTRHQQIINTLTTITISNRNLTKGNPTQQHHSNQQNIQNKLKNQTKQTLHVQIASQ